jgi:hypothetical protein
MNIKQTVIEGTHFLTDCSPIYLRSSLSFGSLKGPKLEIFGFGFFTSINPVWIGDLGTRTKNPKLGWFIPENRHFVLFSAVGYGGGGGEGCRHWGRSLQGKLPSHSFCLLKTESSFYLCGRQAVFYLHTAIV